MEFDYEEFIGERGKTYYAIPFMKNITERVAAVKLMAKALKVKRDRLMLLPVWIERDAIDKDGNKTDLMHFEDVQGTQKMMAVVRK